LENPKASNTNLGLDSACSQGVLRRPLGWEREGERGWWWGWCPTWQRGDQLPSCLGSASGAQKSLHTAWDKTPTFFKFPHLKKTPNFKNKIKPRQMNKKARQMLKEKERNKGFF